MTQIHIIAIDTGNEPHAIRSAAEWWGADVTMTWVGNSDQIVNLLSTEPVQQLIVISGHGDERGLLLPPLAAEIADNYTYNEVICPSDFAQFLHLKNNGVVSLACMGGDPQLAAAFLKGGASFYIGPNGYPNGDASLMYALEFMYNYLCLCWSVADAHHAAADHPDDRKQFILYKGD
ncbi:MAG: hypothetical protein R3C14_30430 [Caldilineaceae bacterium]